MSGSGLLDLQAAEYARLTGDATFTASVVGVYDAAPANPAYPYAVFGESTEVPFREFARNGHEITRTFHLYDRDGASFKNATAKGSKRLLTALNAMIAALESTPLVVGNHATVDYTYEFGQVLEVEDDKAAGLIRHIPARFRAMIQDAS